MKDCTWTISNLLSFTRLLLVVPIVLLLLSEKEFHNWWAVAVMVIATLTDTLDGFLARALHQESDLGKILDPLADKIAIAAVAVLFMIKGVLPIWFVIGAIVRDVTILLGGLYIKNKKEMILQSNLMGKWTVTIVALLIIVSTIDLDVLKAVKMFLLIASTIMLLGSLVLYARRFFEIIYER